MGELDTLLDAYRDAVHARSTALQFPSVLVDYIDAEQQARQAILDYVDALTVDPNLNSDMDPTPSHYDLQGIHEAMKKKRK